MVIFWSRDQFGGKKWSISDPRIPKKYPPNLKNGPRGAKFPFSECQNYTDKSISQIPPGGSKLGGVKIDNFGGRGERKEKKIGGGGVAGVPGQNLQTRGWRSSAWRKSIIEIRIKINKSNK